MQNVGMTLQVMAVLSVRQSTGSIPRCSSNNFQTNSHDIQYTDLHAVRFLTGDLAVLFH
jgi:hypothetical protein